MYSKKTIGKTIWDCTHIMMGLKVDIITITIIKRRKAKAIKKITISITLAIIIKIIITFTMIMMIAINKIKITMEMTRIDNLLNNNLYQSCYLPIIVILNN